VGGVVVGGVVVGGGFLGVGVVGVGVMGKGCTTPGRGGTSEPGAAEGVTVVVEDGDPVGET
jgi:hypothetical protein